MIAMVKIGARDVAYGDPSETGASCVIHILKTNTRKGRLENSNFGNNFRRYNKMGPCIIKESKLNRFPIKLLGPAPYPWVHTQVIIKDPKRPIIGNLKHFIPKGCQSTGTIV